MADSKVAVEDEENSAGTKEEDPHRSSQQEAPSSKEEGNLGNRETQVVVTEQPTNQTTDTKKVEGKEEEASLRETCTAFCQCLCSIGACVLFPCTSECCKCVRSYDYDKISGYLGWGHRWLARGIWRRFSTSFSTYSTNMTTLLKEPIQDEDNRFFRIKASLTSIFVQEVYISSCLICTDKYKFPRQTSKLSFEQNA